MGRIETIQIGDILLSDLTKKDGYDWLVRKIHRNRNGRRIFA